MTTYSAAEVLRISAILSTVALVSGCRSLSLRGEQVRATTFDTDVADCRFLGNVEAYPPYVGPKDAEHNLRNKAADLGGDVVLTHMGVGVATGKVYDCGGRYVRK